MIKSLRIVFLGLAFFGLTLTLQAQVVLGTSPYTQTFDGIGTALPAGWTVRTGASSTVLGTTATYTNAPGTTTAWTNTGGGFKNFASADGLTSSTPTATQTSASDRSLGVRQVTASDVGAAFVMQLSSTSGYENFSMTFELQSLDAGTAPRVATWTIDYGVGAAPTVFTPVTTSPTTLTTGGNTFTSTPVTVNFGTSLDDNSNNIWIRIVILNATTGSGNRPSTGIDDVSLTYSAITSPPNFTANYPKTQNASSTGFDAVVSLDRLGTSYFVVLPNGASAPTSANVKAGQDGGGIGLASNLKGTTAVTASGTEFTSAISGLTPGTDYDLYFVAENSFGLQAAPVKVDATTLNPADATPPSFTSGYPKIQNVTYSAFDLATNLDEAGKTYYVIVGGGATAPSTANIKAGQDAAGNSLGASRSGVIINTSSATEYTASISGLASSTAYDIYFAAEDNIPNLQVNPTLVTVTTPQGPFIENFDACNGNVSSFSQYNVTGTDFWNCSTFGNNTTNGVQINGGYSGGSRQNQDWLISPLLSLTTSAILTFDNRKEFSGDDVVLKISTNYDGVAAPSAATWTDLSYTKSTTAWVSSGPVDLSAYNNQNVYIALVYTSGSVANSGARWSIDNFQVTNTTARFLTTSTTQLPGFGFVTAPAISSSKSYTVTGTGLTQDLTVTAPSNFEISKDNSTFSSSLGFTVAELVSPQTVYVRFHPTAGAGAVSSNVVHTSGTISKNVSVAGTEGANPRDNSLDIVSWNIEWFSITSDNSGAGVGPGAGSGARTAAQVTTQKDNVKAAILAMDADVYALLEVGNENGVFDALVTELGTSGYSGFRSPHPLVPSSSYGTDPAKVQRLGFIYKTSVVSNIKKRVMFETLNTATLTGYPDTDPSRFWASGRYPYIVTADVSLNGVTKKIDFVLIHARANGSESSTNQRYAMRKYDVGVMKDSLDANYANRNFIILGDYNDDVDVTVANPYIATTESSFKRYTDDPTHYIILTRALSDQNLSSFINPATTDMIDHISISDELQSSYIANSVKLEDLRSTPYSISNYVNTTSDHLPVTASFNLVKTPQTITFSLGADAAKNVGDPTFNLSGTSSSGLTVTYTSSNTSVATVAGNVVTIVGPGTTDIKASQAGDGTYAAATDVTQTLTVNKQSQTITFSLGADATKTAGDPTFNLTGIASSGLTVTYTSSNTGVATVAGNVVTIVGGGTTDIKASQVGNGTYAAATDVTQTLTVNKQNQTITFTTIPTRTVGDAAFGLTATSTSGLTVAFSTTSDKVTIAGAQVTIVKAGSVTINANQAGNTSYNAATQVQQTFCINPAKPTITLSNPNTATPLLTSSSTTGNQWYLNGNIIAGATNATYTATAQGSYTLKVTADNCVSVASSAQVLVITGDLVNYPTSSDKLLVYPNPVKSKLTVRLDGFEVKQPVQLSIYDVMGRVVERFTGAGGEDVTLEVGHYATGKYILRAAQSTNVQQQNFVKE